MTVLYTKYKAENNALWSIYVKMVWKSTERFWNLSLEKYGILKWKMCRCVGMCLMLVCHAFLMIMPFVQPILAILLPAVERLLEQCAPDSCTFLPDEAHLLQLLLSKFSEASAPLLVKDPRCLEVFIRALGTSAKPYPTMLSFQIIALEQVGGHLEKALYS